MSDRLKEFDSTGELGNLTQGTLSRLLNNENGAVTNFAVKSSGGLEGILENDFGVMYDETVGDYVVEGDPAGETGGGMTLSPDQAEQLMVAPSESLDSSPEPTCCFTEELIRIMGLSEDTSSKLTGKEMQRPIPDVAGREKL